MGAFVHSKDSLMTTNHSTTIGSGFVLRLKQPRPNRRRGPDSWLKLLTIITVAGWISLGVAFILFDFARPETETLFHHIFGSLPERGWNDTIMNGVFYTVLLCQGMSVAGVFINSRRMRRKSDRYRWSLMGLAIMSSFSTILFTLLNK